MLFNSLQFLVFFPIVVAVFYLLQGKARWLFLLAASYFFYMAWKPHYVLLILFSTLVDFWAAKRMEGAEPEQKRKLLYLSLTSNLGLLFVFKYFNFFADSLGAVSGLELPHLKALLPVGISFYTFQTLAYTIDVYRGKAPVEKSFHRFALYVAFFPQLVAGPIERSQNLLPQFSQTTRFKYKNVAGGLKLMLWGLFKKVVVADRLATFADPVFNNPQAYNGTPLLLATVCFAFQIYCDFSGYSDMAIGAAQVLGVRLMDNFNRPYAATSIGDFWQRWHISLSTWFRDYVYLPLGGNRVSLGRWYANILIVFVVSGLWHGANWTYVAWGFIHALYYLVERLTNDKRKSILASTGMLRYPAVVKLLGILYTFSIVCLAWIFFRAKNVGDAFYIIGHLWPQGALSLSPELVTSLQITCSMVMILLLVEWKQTGEELRDLFSDRPTWLRWSILLGIVYCILLTGVFESRAFIYFQF